MHVTAAQSSPLRDAFCIAAGLLVLYHLLAQRALHGLDVYQLVPWLATGTLDHPYHYLYLNVIAGVWSLLQPMGVGAFANTVFCSALGTSAGLFFLHLAAARLAPSSAPRWVTLLCATAPGIVFFATVAEVHGLFLGFAGIAWWLYSRFENQPTWGRTLLVAVGTALAASVHATGHFLVGAMGLWYLARKGWAWQLLGFAAMHCLLVVLVVQLLRPGAATPLQSQLAFIAEAWPNWLDCVTGLPFVFWSEWLWGMAPLSLAPLVALFFLKLRKQALALLLILAAYLIPSTMMLVYFQAVERGAYFVPLVFPAALLVVQMKQPALVLGTVALGAAISITTVALHDSPASADDFAKDMLVATAGTKPALICAGHDEWDPVMRVAPHVPTRALSQLVTELQNKDVAGAKRHFAGILNLVQNVFGHQIYISQRALRLMHDQNYEQLNALARDYIPEHYRLQEVKSGSFTGHRLVPK